MSVSVCKKHGNINFVQNGINKNGTMQYRCPLCKKEWNSKFQKKNPDYHRQKTQRWREKHKPRQKWIEYLYSIVEVKCQKCGYDRCFAAIEFHHREKKEITISRIFDKTFNDENKKLLIEELKKCIILCATCHKEEHNDFLSVMENKLLWR